MKMDNKEIHIIFVQTMNVHLLNLLSKETGRTKESIATEIKNKVVTTFKNTPDYKLKAWLIDSMNTFERFIQDELTNIN